MIILTPKQTAEYIIALANGSLKSAWSLFLDLRDSIIDAESVEAELLELNANSYDPLKLYDANNSLLGVCEVAEDFGVHIKEIVRECASFESAPYLVIRVHLFFREHEVYIQISPDGKMKMFNMDGQRIDNYNGQQFFDLASNDPDTLKSRIEAFRKGASFLSTKNSI